MTADQFLWWFVTSFLGALLVKLLDIAVNRFQKRQFRKEENISKLLDFLTDYGELVSLYRFIANLSRHIVRDESGDLAKDKDGKYVVESKVLEPDPQFEAAIKDLDGVDIKSAITRKITEIRLKYPEAQDISLIVDPSGGLKEQLRQLYLDTIFSIESVIKYKDAGNADDTFMRMVESLEKADDTRSNVRAKLQKFLNK